MNRWICLLIVVACTAEIRAGELPAVPVGLDAYRQWDRWPMQRIGVRAYMRSTYDRSGGNEAADASHFLYGEGDAFHVTLDEEGPGVLVFARYNHWHGSPWHYEVDGKDHIVQETSSADPANPVEGSIFLPEAQFPNLLTWTWSITKGADLMWVPIPFEKSFRMAYSRTHYGTGYYIFHRYVPGIPLSQPIQSWKETSTPDADVLDLLARAGTDIAPKDIATVHGSAGLAASDDFRICALAGPSTIRVLKIAVPRDAALDFGRARLRITWDGRPEPSIDAPVSLFFGAGVLYNRDDREYLVKALPVNIRYDADRVYLACYFPMPFFNSAVVEIAEIPEACKGEVSYEVRHEAYSGPPEQVGYLHATYRDHPEPKPGHDVELLDTSGIEGEAEWTGSFIGTSFIFSHDAVLNSLEGDPRFFIDDCQTPNYGTGTEEWGGGGDYWGGRNMTLPLAGHPVGAKSAEVAVDGFDKIQSAYRFLLADLMPFGRRAVIRLEHGGLNHSTEHYGTVTYWYGLPAASLVKTDELDVGDVRNEASHGYDSPDSTRPVEVTSRYEWGPGTYRPNRGGGPMSEPASFAEIEFEAKADIPYAIWVRGRAFKRDQQTDSFWLQFDEAIGTTGLGEGHAGQFGFGNWLDGHPPETYSWSSGRPQDPPQTVTFTTPGRHRVRIQQRQGGHLLDQIWLSPSQRDLPADNASRESGGGNIVLTLSDRPNLSGKFSLMADADASNGRALRIAVQGQAVEVYPAHTETGRTTTGASSFTLRLRPDNEGVLLRRTLDYSYPNQRARVYVAGGGDEVADSERNWEYAGIWYEAGSNTCYHSNPRGELDPPNPVVQTSNRRFRDDEFLVPRELTRGREMIRVRVEFTPVERPLMPGMDVPELAWSELRYEANCFVVPDWKPARR